MRIKFWGRLLIAVCGLMTLAFAVALFAYGAGFFPFQLDLSALNIDYKLWQRAVIVGVALMLAAIGIFSICFLFRRGKGRGFIIQHTEYGDMSISLRALENMVKKCVESHKELIPGTTYIGRNRDGIVVAIKVTLNGSANIPQTVNALQKQIKEYISSSSGVDVKEVRVMVETNPHKLMSPEKTESPVAKAPEVASASEPVVEPAPTAPQEEPAEAPIEPAEPTVEAAEPSDESGWQAPEDENKEEPEENA